MKRLLLIDGNAILHRAYHAYPPLNNPKGEEVSAVYGFFSMLLSVLQNLNPDYLVVCFDRSKPTIRQSMFAGYHAHRPQATDGFISQIILVHDLLLKMNVSVFELEGYEADDLIGTIATKTVKGKNNTEVIILTGDRDMLQLVNSHVRVLMPLVGITKTALFDEEKVEEKYGVTPSQFIDYKALIGDPSDGYPGVTGIGPKGASKLLQEYKTFENLYKRVDDLPEKTGLMLATDAEQAALAKKLATIITDAPIQFDLKKCACSGFDIKAIKEGFEEQAFHSLIKRLDTQFAGHERIEEEKPEKKTDEQLGLLEF